MFGKSQRLTIDELSQKTGQSSRAIRYYQTRGLLPPPRVEGRIGYYDDQHLDRLTLIQELQGEGLNLQAIGWLLGGAGSVASDELRGLKRAVLDGWVVEEPVEISVEELVSELGLEELDLELVGRAQRLGLLELDEDAGHVRILLPTILRAGRELDAMGVGIARALDVLELLRASAETVAHAFVELFDEAVVAPFDARGRPSDDWAEVRASVERLRPLAGEALLAVFHRVMREVVAEQLANAGMPDDTGA